MEFHRISEDTTTGRSSAPRLAQAVGFPWTYCYMGIHTGSHANPPSRPDGKTWAYSYINRFSVYAVNR